jgi:hypothetical protein
MRRKDNLHFELHGPHLLLCSVMLLSLLLALLCILLLALVATHIDAHADVLRLGHAMHVKQTGQAGMCAARQEGEQRRKVFGAYLLRGQQGVECCRLVA